MRLGSGRDVNGEMAVMDMSEGQGGALMDSAPLHCGDVATMHMRAAQSSAVQRCRGKFFCLGHLNATERLISEVNVCSSVFFSFRWISRCSVHFLPPIVRLVHDLVGRCLRVAGRRCLRGGREGRFDDLADLATQDRRALSRCLSLD